MLNILIPMAGRGSRFADAGYSFPKPIIDVSNKPMIQVVVENLNLKGRHIFLVLKEHMDKYSMRYLLPLICKENPCEIVVVDKVTQGAACTALLAKDFINNDDSLILANSDQWVDWSSEHFINFCKNKDVVIPSFISCHPKWSFIKLNEEGLVTEVAEKRPISNIATVGIYYWNKGSDFVSSAEEMIKRNLRDKGEFYVAPSINLLLEKGRKAYSYPVAEMRSLGVPEDLEAFLKLNK